MTKIDLDTLSLDELKQLQKNVAKAIDRFEERQRKEALAALEQKAKEFGFSLSELTGGTTAKRKTLRPAKYRHPENPDLTWTGRGRKPRWFTEAIANGMTPAQLEIA